MTREEHLEKDAEFYGRSARVAGLRLYQNPFAVNRRSWYAWNAGWKAEAKAIRERLQKQGMVKHAGSDAAKDDSA